MALHITRRDLLKLAGGSALGVVLSPLPWKLLDDSAIWTQNWSLIPKLARGPLTVRYSACTLCGAGCALQARCVGGVPVTLAGVAGHPLTRGALCPIGLSSHHLAHHPLRLARPVRIAGKTNGARVEPADLESILAMLGPTVRSIAAGREKGAIAVLDRQPGRALSLAYREFLAGFPEGLSLVPSNLEDETTNALRAMAVVDPGPSGLDFTGVKTVLSFGAPVLDGWGIPGAMMDLFREKHTLGIRFIQVEPRPSRTALAADRWLRNTPGTEREIAWGIARVLVDEKLIPSAAFRSIAEPGRLLRKIGEVDLNRTAAKSGISSGEIAAVAREISRSATVVIAGSDPAGGPMDPDTRNVIALLNLIVTPPDAHRGIVRRNLMPDEPKGKTKPAFSLDEVPDHSLRLLIIDSAESGYVVSSDMVRRKMRKNDGQIVALASTLTPLAAAADIIIPVAAPFERIDEAPHAPSAGRDTFSLSLPLHPERAGSDDPLSFLVRLATSADRPPLSQTTTGALLRHRSDAIYTSRRGRVFLPADRSTVAVTQVDSADRIWQHFHAGGCWIDDSSDISSRTTFTFPVRENERVQPVPMDHQIVLMPFGWKAATATALVSPTMSKLFQESAIRDLEGIALISPATASEHGLEDAAPARISTARGSMEVKIRLDAAVRPGVVHAAVGPRPNGQETPLSPAANGVLSLCDTDNDGTWRITMATIEKG